MDWDVISGSCACLAGFELVYDESTNQASCNPCLFDYSKAVHGPELCIEGCSEEYEYDTSTGSCSKCPLEYTKLIPGTDPCRLGCPMGSTLNYYHWDRPERQFINEPYPRPEPCKTCPTDWSTPNYAEELCSECPTNSYTPDNGPHICVCNATTHVTVPLIPIWGTIPNIHPSCECKAGYEYDSESGGCSVCPEDFEKTESGDHACTMCSIGYNTPGNGPHVCVCDTVRNHVMDHELNLCGCIAGYGYDLESGVCSLCATDFEKTEPGAEACTMCPIGYNTPDDGPHVCICDATRNGPSSTRSPSAPTTTPMP